MSKFDKAFLRKIVRGGLADYSHAHPDKAVDPSSWNSIAKRVAGPVWAEYRLRFGDAPDRLLEAWLVRQWVKRLQRRKGA
jgi:hypothetical protein